jgi:hypothetical protein
MSLKRLSKKQNKSVKSENYPKGLNIYSKIYIYIYMAKSINWTLILSIIAIILSIISIVLFMQVNNYKARINTLEQKVDQNFGVASTSLSEDDFNSYKSQFHHDLSTFLKCISHELTYANAHCMTANAYQSQSASSEFTECETATGLAQSNIASCENIFINKYGS